jgi:hypothetical protein
MAANPVKSDIPPPWGRLNPRDYVDVTLLTKARIEDLAKRNICMRLLPVGKTDAMYPGFDPSIRYCLCDLEYTIESYKRGAYGKHHGGRLYWFPFGVDDPPDWDSFRTMFSPWTYENKDILYGVSDSRHI